jgi:hypothetical protein
MSSYRHLIVCAILFFVVFYGSANFAKAESMPTNCDYEHVAMLFGAKGFLAIDPSSGEVTITTKCSANGLYHNSTYDLDWQPIWTCTCWGNYFDRTFGEGNINMRDVAQAIRNYQKSQST